MQEERQPHIALYVILYKILFFALFLILIIYNFKLYIINIMQLKEYINKTGMLFIAIFFTNIFASCVNDKNKNESELTKQEQIHNQKRGQDHTQYPSSQNVNQSKNDKNTQEFDNSITTIDDDKVYSNNPTEKLKSLIEDYKINKNKADFLQGFYKLNLDKNVTNFIEENYHSYFKQLSFLEEIKKVIFSKILSTPVFGKHLQFTVSDLDQNFRINKIKNKINKIEKLIKPIFTLEESENLIEELNFLEDLLNDKMNCAKRIHIEHVRKLINKIKNSRNKELNSLQEKLDKIYTNSYNVSSIDNRLQKVNEIEITADKNNKISIIDKQIFKKYCLCKKNKLLSQKPLANLTMDYWINLNKLLLSQYSWDDFIEEATFLGDYHFERLKKKNLKSKDQYTFILNKFKSIHDKIKNNEHFNQKLGIILRERDKIIKYLNKKIQELS
ncbi:MAG: hypothetical protein GY830_05020 [Bacteroidetes bacterium]|nr:hypothetical protein [Bacteroidota bacterium]